jgi:hypothetical protein
MTYPLLKKILYSIIICVITLSFYTTVFAQTNMLNSSNDISVGLIPATPQPNQEVLVTIESYSINLDTSKISWYLNDTLVTQGIGVKKTSIKVGALGSTNVLRIRVESGIEVFTKIINISPSSVTILWEAQTYTPPFFKGKALFTHQSLIKFFAAPQIIVNNREIPKEDLIYTWSKDGSVLGDESGYGKYTLSINGSIISRTLSIDVTVQDPKSGISAFNTIDITPQEPEIVFYKKDPLYGTQYQKALSDRIPLNTREFTIDAVPYFFSTSRAIRSGALSFSWSVNGSNIENIDTDLVRTFRTTGNDFGSANISLSIEQPQRILQYTSKSITVDFIKENSDQTF